MRQTLIVIVAVALLCAIGLVTPALAAQSDSAPTPVVGRSISEASALMWRFQVRSLQAQVRLYRSHARATARRLGLYLEPTPLTTNWAVLADQREHWKKAVAYFAHRLAAHQLAVQAAQVTAPAPVVAASSSTGLIADFNCISIHEEYGVTGQNTVAGYFGMVSPPSAYPEPGPTYANEYGDSWLDIPLAAQYDIAIAEYHTYGWSPWSTAPDCGL